MKGYILLLALLFSLGANAQSSKEVKEKGIVSQHVYEIDYSEGLNTEVLEKEDFFDAAGNLIELKEYNSKGEVDLWEKYTYTDDGEIKTETYLDKKGNVEKKVVYEYEDGLKTAKLYYDAKDRLLKKKKYVYKFRK